MDSDAIAPADAIASSLHPFMIAWLGKDELIQAFPWRPKSSGGKSAGLTAFPKINDPFPF